MDLQSDALSTAPWTRGSGGRGGVLNLRYGTDVRLRFFMAQPINIFCRYQNIYLLIYLFAKRHLIHLFHEDFITIHIFHGFFAFDSSACVERMRACACVPHGVVTGHGLSTETLDFPLIDLTPNGSINMSLSICSRCKNNQLTACSYLKGQHRFDFVAR